MAEKRLAAPKAVARIAVAVVSLAAGTSVGLAKPLPLDMSTSQPGEEEFKRALATYAECLSQYRGKELPQFMNTAVADSRSGAALRALAKANPGCARPKRPPKVMAEGLALRGALIEWAYTREFGRPTAPLTFKDVPHHAYLSPLSKDDRTAQLMSAGMMALFDCVVREQPAEVAEMLRAPIESPGETQAFAKLTPAFVTCLPANWQVKMRASNVRPYLAEAFYTLTKLKQANSVAAPAP